jgi:HD superfamily phosphohydrolase
MAGNHVLSDFQGRVNDLVTDALSEYNPQRHAKEKSIRDAVLGTCRFCPWEVAILDSPLVQRLRDIRQTGLAYLVYPTSVHSRFDHTLGVVTISSRIVRSINDKHPLKKDPLISYEDHMRIRLSALLHDVGHSCLSHVSESIFGASPEFEELLVTINEMFGVTPKPHEIMSWLIVQSSRFKQFIRELVQKKILVGWDCAPEHIDQIAGNIVGYRKDPSEKYHADIINGPMDADKLDYLVRDAYFAGPTVVYDLERFLHTVDAIEYPRHDAANRPGTKIVKLSIPIEGVTALEQIIISKLMLFSYLYHHHKIRCVEGMYHEVLKRWRDLPPSGHRGKELFRLDHPVCFLSISDRSLFPGEWPPDNKGDKVATEIINRLVRRDLYKRALVISRIFISDIDTNANAKNGFSRLLVSATSPEETENLRTRIFEEAQKIMLSKRYKEHTKDLRRNFKMHHLLLDVPKSPTIEETEGVMVPISLKVGSHEMDFVPLTEIFPIEKWVDAYNAIKWRGHIFAIEEATPFVNLSPSRGNEPESCL